MSAPSSTPLPVIDAYVALGGNVGAVHERIACAVQAMRGWPFVRAVTLSSLVRSAPVGPVTEQPAFVNAVASLAVVGATAEELFARLAALERELGRTPGVPQGPREIDLDLIAFGDQRLAGAKLTLPHPRAHLRRFVLAPLAEVAGERYVLAGKPVAEWLAAPEVEAQDIEPWEP